MELKIHTLGFRGSAPKQPGEKAGGSIHCMIEIDGHLIDRVDRVVLITKHDEFQTAVVRLIPGEVETIVHDDESWKALAERLKED